MIMACDTEPNAASQCAAKRDVGCGSCVTRFSWSIQLRVTVREMKEGPSGSAIMGFVSRVTPVQTALCNCTGDEGGPFGFGDQVADPKPPQAAAVKSRGGERCGKVGTRSRQVWSREASASEPSMKCRKLLR